MAAPIYSKVKAMSLAGAAVAIVAWALNYFAGIVLPTEVVSAMIVVVGFFFGYFKIEKQG